MSPHDLWLTTEFNKELNAAVVALAGTQPEFRRLIIDAVSHGRKIRSNLAFIFAQQNGWSVSSNCIADLANLELLHSASCVLDDVIDGDVVRRGMPSFHVRNGLAQALLTCLLMVAIPLCKSDLVGVQLGETLERMIIGEGWDAFLASVSIGGERHLVDKYLEKTVPSFEVAHFIVAHHADCSLEDIKQAVYFGGLLGKMYQVANDFYDIFEIPTETRGEGGDDVLVNLSVPMCFLMESDPSVSVIIGNRIKRIDLFALRERMLAVGADKKTRAFLEEIKKALGDFFSGGLPQEYEEIISRVDSVEFWSYKYE
ncbi:MAG: polyprenyl synthetase family protein [Candidatus Magasanikbacteria bacterium]